MLQILIFITEVCIENAGIQLGNGQFISVLFSIQIIINIHGHRYKIYTLVSEIDENVDLVFGIKNIFELEGIINSQKSCFSFFN